jgi:hypothetical protein
MKATLHQTLLDGKLQDLPGATPVNYSCGLVCGPSELPDYALRGCSRVTEDEKTSICGGNPGGVWRAPGRSVGTCGSEPAGAGNLNWLRPVRAFCGTAAFRPGAAAGGGVPNFTIRSGTRRAKRDAAGPEWGCRGSAPGSLVRMGLGCKRARGARGGPGGPDRAGRSREPVARAWSSGPPRTPPAVRFRLASRAEFCQAGRGRRAMPEARSPSPAASENRARRAQKRAAARASQGVRFHAPRSARHNPRYGSFSHD